MFSARCLQGAFAVAVIVSFAPIQRAQAVLIGGYDVIGTFNYLDARTTNTVGTPSGVRVTFGINVAPVGTQPTPSLDGTTVTATQGGFTFQVPYEFTPVAPNAFGRSIDFASFPTLTGPWTLTLTNPTVNAGAPASVVTRALAAAVPPPFVSSVLLTPDPVHPTQPTIGWDLGGYTPSNSRIEIANKGLLTPAGLPTVIYAAGISATANAFTIPAGVLNTTDQYTFSVELDQRTPSGILAGRSRTFVDFTAAVNHQVFLPVTGIDADPIDLFGPPFLYDFPVVAGVPIAIDPRIAIGYEYRIGIGNPLFASVMLPDIGDPDGYQLCLWTGTSYDSCSTHLDAGQTYSFIGGTTRFEVIAIDPTLGLDPTDTTAFVTMLTFLTSGEFTGTQTPLLASVPEPRSAALLGIGLLGVFGSLRRRRLVRGSLAALGLMFGIGCAHAESGPVTASILTAHPWCFSEKGNHRFEWTLFPNGNYLGDQVPTRGWPAHGTWQLLEFDPPDPVFKRLVIVRRVGSGYDTNTVDYMAKLKDDGNVQLKPYGSGGRATLRRCDAPVMR